MQKEVEKKLIAGTGKFMINFCVYKKSGSLMKKQI